MTTSSGAGFAILMAVTFGVAVYDGHQQNQRHIPPHAGLVCDMVWKKTRPGKQPTVGWHEKCINTAADMAEEAGHEE